MSRIEARGHKRTCDGDPPLQLEAENVRWIKRRLPGEIRWSMYTRFRSADGAWKEQHATPHMCEDALHVQRARTRVCTHGSYKARVRVRAALAGWSREQCSLRRARAAVNEVHTTPLRPWPTLRPRTMTSATMPSGSSRRSCRPSTTRATQAPQRTSTAMMVMMITIIMVMLPRGPPPLQSWPPRS